MKDINILITNVNLIASVELMKIIKQLKFNNITIYGTSVLKKGFSYGSNLVDQFILISENTFNDKARYYKEIISICKNHNINIAFSVLDEEIKLLTKLNIETDTKFISANEKTIEQLEDNLSASIAISNIGIDIPPILNSIIGEKKIIFRKRNSVGSKGIYIVDLEKSQYIENHFNDSYFIQRYVHGVEYTVDVFTDKFGSPKLIIPRKRIEIRNGISFRCQLEHNKKIIEICKKIYNNFYIPGLSNVQFIISNDKIYFIEINLRFAGTGVAGIMASFNYINDYLNHFINDEKLKDFDYYMSKVAWGSIITKSYDSIIYYQNEN